MPRLFIAVDVTAEIKDALRGVQTQFEAVRLPVRWTKPEMMHLTLVFLGETDPRDFERVGHALSHSLASIHPYDLQLGTLGVFPTLARPKVIWCSIDGATDEHERLQGAIAAAVGDIVPRRETRAYTPHLTIGRVRQDANTAERRLVGNAVGLAPALPRVSWRVDQAVLYESVPASGGVRHVKRLSAPFGSAINSPSDSGHSCRVP